MKQFFLNRKTEKLAFLMLVISEMISVLTLRFYYADGGFFLVDLLGKKYSRILPVTNDYAVFRISSNMINQIPASVYITLSETVNMKVLNLLFGIPLCFNWVWGILICFLLSRKYDYRKQLIIPVGFYVLFCIPSEIFSINPALTAYWTILILYYIIIIPKRAGAGRFLASAVAVLIAAASHETFIVTAPVLILIIFFEMLVFKDGMDKVYGTVIALSVLAGMIYDISFLRSHDAAESLYISHLLEIIKNGKIFCTGLTYSFLGLIFILICRQIQNRSLAVLIILCICYTGIRLLLHISDPGAEYRTRSLITFASAGGIMLSWILYRFEGKIRVKPDYSGIAAVIAVVCIFQSIWSVCSSVEWSGYIRSFRKTLSAGKGMIYAEELYDNKYNWYWTPPSLSLLLQKDSGIKALVLPQDPEMVYWDGARLYIPFIYVDERVYDIRELRE